MFWVNLTLLFCILCILFYLKKKKKAIFSLTCLIALQSLPLKRQYYYVLAISQAGMWVNLSDLCTWTGVTAVSQVPVFGSNSWQCFGGWLFFAEDPCCFSWFSAAHPSCDLFGWCCVRAGVQAGWCLLPAPGML